jgi:hypothetical protein
MPKENLEWFNTTAAELPADVKKAFEARAKADRAFGNALEASLKKAKKMPDGKHIRWNVRGESIGFAYADAPQSGGGGRQSFKW